MNSFNAKIRIRIKNRQLLLCIHDFLWCRGLFMGLFLVIRLLGYWVIELLGQSLRKKLITHNSELITLVSLYGYMVMR